MRKVKVEKTPLSFCSRLVVDTLLSLLGVQVGNPSPRRTCLLLNRRFPQDLCNLSFRLLAQLVIPFSCLNSVLQLVLFIYILPSILSFCLNLFLGILFPKDLGLNTPFFVFTSCCVACRLSPGLLWQFLCCLLCFGISVPVSFTPPWV